MDEEVLFTIGYQGLALNDFTEKLKENKIQTLIDIREIPLSRKKGFSKNTLKENITKGGVGYTHFKQLGSPRELRKKLYQDSDYEFFFSRFYFCFYNLPFFKDAQGVPDEQIKKAIAAGINKVNIDAGTRLAFTAAIREFLATNKENFDPREILSHASEAIKQNAKEKVLLFGSSGKA